LTLFVSEEEQSIGEYLEENSETYSQFYQLAIQAGILKPLKLYNPYGDGKFTLFLPGDDAFETFLGQSGYNSYDAFYAGHCGYSRPLSCGSQQL